MKIEQKWGFGMAPPFPNTQVQRTNACAAVEGALTSGSIEDIGAVLQHLSTVKGLFTRTWKQDQWDWFTVWRQLGEPGFRCSRKISDDLYALRRATMVADLVSVEQALSLLRENRIHRHLRVFQGKESYNWDGGYLYILSSRENPRLLKIGYTEREVEARAKEINSSTGILVPLGVRALWKVRKAGAMEQLVHQELGSFRIRSDREFFEMEYGDACKRISALLLQRSLEVDD